MIIGSIHENLNQEKRVAMTPDVVKKYISLGIKVNLPKTKLAMKANLPNKEPDILKYWDTINLYELQKQTFSKREKFIDKLKYAAIIHIFSFNVKYQYLFHHKNGVYSERVRRIHRI